MNDQFHSGHDYVAYFQEFPTSTFTSVSGGESSNEVTQQFPGGGRSPQNIVGPTTITAVQLQKPFDHIKDAALVAWSRAWDRGARRELTLVVQPVTSEGIPTGEAETFIGCARTSFKKPDVNAGSADVAMLAITVQPRRKQ